MLVPAAHEPRGHGGDDAGDVQRLAHEERRPAHEHRGRDDEVLVLQPAHDEHPHRADDRAHGEPAERQRDEAANGGSRAERAREGRRDREPEQHEPGRVVEQALALEDDRQSVGQAHPLQHRTRRDGVRRRNDGAERTAGGPGQGGQERVRDDGHDDRRAHHRADGQRQDADEVALELAERDEPRPVHEERRQEDREHQLGVERDLRQARNERERGTAHDERDGRGQPEAAREEVERDDREQHRDQELELGHRIHVHGHDLERRYREGSPTAIPAGSTDIQPIG